MHEATAHHSVGVEVGQVGAAQVEKVCDEVRDGTFGVFGNGGVEAHKGKLGAVGAAYVEGVELSPGP